MIIMYYSSFKIFLLVIIRVGLSVRMGKKRFCYEIFHNNFVSLDLLLSLGFYAFEFGLGLWITKSVLNFIDDQLDLSDLCLW